MKASLIALAAGLLVRDLSVIGTPKLFSAATAATFQHADDLIEQEELISYCELQ